ncbi:MAG: N-acetyl-gamma-glutamyl-phosphate reductase [Chloroflexi bacterium RBG_16_56_11]|nr:MAG: N-acetyl-gamma-glutamyl-phosphate reductase [Chloroflexi bacterium RBG_16_56_11]
MKKNTVFVDGQHGTTGLKIRERLHGRTDIDVIEIAEEKRKDPETRKKLMNEADIVFLCLPDDAARESVSLIKNSSVRVIDGSTAHRLAEGWVYGLPELKKEQRTLIKKSRRIAVPGCHATGFVLMLYPLIAEGIVPPDYPVSSHAVAGYSGGGKAMISDYENGNAPDFIKNPRPYSLGLNHKHLPEMTRIAGLTRPPVFAPTVVNVYNGEIISIPLLTGHLKKRLSAADIREVLARYYAGERFVRVIPYPPDDYLKNGFMTFTDCNGTNNLDIFVFGNEDRILLSGRFDNLGKGASGAAIQDMNLVLGLPETQGLEEAAIFP